MSLLRILLSRNCGHLSDLNFLAGKGRRHLIIKRDLRTVKNAIPKTTDSPDLDLSDAKTNTESFSHVDTKLTHLSNSSTSKLPDHQKQDELRNYFLQISNIEEYERFIEKIDVNTENVMMLVKKLMYLYLNNKNSAEEVKKMIDFAKGKEFEKLCTVLDKVIHFVPFFDVSYVFNILYNYQVPLSCTLMQKIYALLLNNMNRYTILEALNIYCKIYIPELDDVEVAQILKLALIKYMVHCFDNKRNSNMKINSLVYYFPKKIVPASVRKKIFNLALNDIKRLTPTSYLFLLKGMNYLGQAPNNDYNQIISGLKKIIKVDWPKYVIHDLAIYYSTGVSNKLFMYDEDLSEFFTECAINDFDITSSCHMMKFLCSFDNCNIFLLQKIVSNIKGSVPWSVAESLLHVLSATGFTQLQDHEKSTIKTLYKSINYSDIFNNDENKISESSIINCALGLAVIEVYQKDVLDKFVDVLTHSYNTDELKNLDVFSYWGILCIDQWISVFHPKHEKRLSSEILSECLTQVRKGFSVFSLISVLREVFGGEKYILTNCTTSLNHCLSYAVALGPDKKPLDFSHLKNNNANDFPNIEKIELPPNLKWFVVQEFPIGISVNFNNVPIQMARIQMFIDILGKLGIFAMAVNQFDYNKELDYESCLYLEHLVNEKLGRLFI